MHKNIVLVCALLGAAAINATDNTSVITLPEGAKVEKFVGKLITQCDVQYRTRIKNVVRPDLGPDVVLSCFKKDDEYWGNNGYGKDTNLLFFQLDLAEAKQQFETLEAAFKAQEAKKEAESKEQQSEKA